MKLSKLSSEDLQNIEDVVGKVVSSKIDPFREEFQELKKEFQEYKKVSIEWFEAIFDDLQGKHQEMSQLKSQVSRFEKIQSITV